MQNGLTAYGIVGPGPNQKPLIEWGSALHYVYLGVFEDRGLAFVKVGISDNPENRIDGLVTNCPFVLSSLYLCQAPTRAKAFGLEQSILTRYKALSTRGEWLRMEADKVRPWIARLSLLAMERFGREFMFKPHRRRYKPMPEHLKRKVRQGA